MTPAPAPKDAKIMDEVVFKMVAAGILFGCWPLLMNRSGLTGTTSTVAFGSIVLLCIVPIILKNGISISGANWWYVIAAGCCGGLGLLTFNDGLAKATPMSVGRLFIIMIVVQTAVAALYSTIMNGQLAFKTGAGFAAAALTAILLA